jgi:antitoxin CptB
MGKTEDSYSVNELLSKLRWRCRRGMKELDVLLLGYLEGGYQTASEEKQRAFAELLDCQDPQLMGYIMGRETPSDNVLSDLIHDIRDNAHG